MILMFLGLTGVCINKAKFEHGYKGEGVGFIVIFYIAICIFCFLRSVKQGQVEQMKTLSRLWVQIPSVTLTNTGDLTVWTKYLEVGCIVLVLFFLCNR